MAEKKKRQKDFSKWNEVHHKMQESIGDDIVAVMKGHEPNILDQLDDGGDDKGTGDKKAGDEKDKKDE